MRRRVLRRPILPLSHKMDARLIWITVFNLPAGRCNSKSCQFQAAHASFILIMLLLVPLVIVIPWIVRLYVEIIHEL